MCLYFLWAGTYKLHISCSLQGRIKLRQKHSILVTRTGSSGKRVKPTCKMPFQWIGNSNNFPLKPRTFTVSTPILNLIFIALGFIPVENIVKSIPHDAGREGQFTRFSVSFFIVLLPFLRICIRVCCVKNGMDHQRRRLLFTRTRISKLSSEILPSHAVTVYRMKCGCFCELEKAGWFLSLFFQVTNKLSKNWKMFQNIYANRRSPWLAISSGLLLRVPGATIRVLFKRFFLF